MSSLQPHISKIRVLRDNEFRDPFDYVYQPSGLGQFTIALEMKDLRIQFVAKESYKENNNMYFEEKNRQLSKWGCDMSLLKALLPGLIERNTPDGIHPITGEQHPANASFVFKNASLEFPQNPSSTSPNEPDVETQQDQLKARYNTDDIVLATTTHFLGHLLVHGTIDQALAEETLHNHFELGEQQAKLLLDRAKSAHRANAPDSPGGS